MVAWQVNLELAGIDKLPIEKDLGITLEMLHQLLPIAIFLGSHIPFYTHNLTNSYSWVVELTDNQRVTLAPFQLPLSKYAQALFNQ